MIVPVLAFLFLFAGPVCVLALCRAAAKGDGPEPLRWSTDFYCERCEQRTAERVSSKTVTVVYCRTTKCGFRRLLRDEIDPGKVGVLHDPGPTEGGQLP